MIQQRRWLRQLRWLAEAAVAMPLLALGAILPEILLPTIAKMLGNCIYYLSPDTRRWCLLNLQIAHAGRLNHARLQSLAKSSLAHQVLLYCQTLRLTPRLIDQRLVIDGMEYVPAILSRGRGVVAVIGHLGHYEYLSPALWRIGLPNLVISRPLDNPFMRWMQERCRRRIGTRFIGKDANGIRNAMRHLKQGGGIIIAIDLNTIQNPVFVDLFGIPAATPRGAADMALRLDCDVILLTSHRGDNGKHVVTIHPPFDLIQTGEHEADVMSNTQQFTSALASQILRHPDQYFWQHPRFRFRPDGSTWTSKTSLQTIRDASQAQQRIGH
ncbi:MAG: lysophospholipid acyltransferase family protein [Phycisphaerales bacterium]|jgi:KDO2-lipid IV(A) lauroyltransferase|nr:lysophospholipid acyltransferase family protein [Phycisphaerales bacterium]